MNEEEITEEEKVESDVVKKTKKCKKKISWIYYVLLGIAVLIIAYCIWAFLINKKEDKKEDKKTEEVIKDEPKELQIVDLDSDSRPIAVMVNNISVARPYQSGLQDAYIVYEIIVESGITRFMAVYKDANTDRIGSVRSSRDYYLDYALENDAIYVHYGWSPQAQSYIKILKVNNINGLFDDAFWRESLNIAYEHTAFTSISKIKTVAEAKDYRMTTEKDLLLNYSVDEVDLSKDENSSEANLINIRYSTGTKTTYAYDKEDNLYYRSVNGSKHTDYITKKQYTTKNIIIVYVDNGYISNDLKGRQELDNIGTGDGFYITDGYSIPITWSKSSRSSQTVYKKISGEEIDVNDGNTYIQIAPVNSATISE